MFLMLLHAIVVWLSPLQFTQAEEQPCVCSPFHYEEQMLEKMVRMEFEMQRMKTETDEAREAMEAAVEEFKQIKTTHGESMENSLKEIEKLKDSVRTPTVAFKAKKVKNQRPRYDEIFVFLEELYDHGGHYNNLTGIFSAPVAGTYLFTMQICLIPNKHMYYGIMVENERFSNGLFYEKDIYNCNSADAIVVLKSGDRVWLQFLRSSDKGMVIEGNDDYRWNTFSGTLIHV